MTPDTPPPSKSAEPVAAEKKSTDKGDAKETKVTHDFGGRRKVLDRRLKQVPIQHRERRKGRDRRSGFDRRSAENHDIGDDETKRDIDHGENG